MDFILGAPKILLDPFGQHITVPAGEPFKIKVPYKGSPAPTATFYNVSISYEDDIM